MAERSANGYAGERAASIASRVRCVLDGYTRALGAQVARPSGPDYLVPYVDEGGELQHARRVAIESPSIRGVRAP